MFSRSKKPTVKKSAIVEETPLFAQLLPFANRMNDIINMQQPLPKRSTCVQQAANRLKPWNGDLSETGA